MNSGTDDGVKATPKIVSIEMFVMMRRGIKRMRMMIMIYDASRLSKRLHWL